MKCWLVMQGATFEEEFQGNFLWAPHHNEAGNCMFYWSNMRRLRPGDIVLSYVNLHIRAISVVQRLPMDAPKPPSWKSKAPNWSNIGWQAKLDYEKIDPIDLRPLWPTLVERSQKKYSAFNTQRVSGNQGYLYELTPEAADVILGKVTGNFDSDRAEGDIAAGTDQATLTKIRIGQAAFRAKLLELWGHKCCVTGCEKLELLRASHIVPWATARTSERIDPYNGLPLAANYDIAFDRHFISFDETGRILKSPRIEWRELSKLGVIETATLSRLDDRHAPYLARHRELTKDA